jgi:hypothetical protein
MRYVLDTNFVIDVLRGERAAADRFARLLEDGDEPYVNEVVMCELAVGLRSADDPGFRAFVRAAAFVQPPPEAAIEAGVWRRAARQRGRTLNLADALIAAAAVSLGAPLITRNRTDFELTPVTVETY